MTALLFVAGLVVLVAGGEVLVRGAARLAAATGISPLVVGLTVVAFGTSSPELAVSVQAGISGQVDIAVGNVVGSNIFNVLLILGMSAALVPLVVSAQLVRLDVPIMIGVSLLLLVLAIDGSISRVECAIFVLLLISYVTAQIVISRRTPMPETDEPVETGRTWVNSDGRRNMPSGEVFSRVQDHVIDIVDHLDAARWTATTDGGGETATVTPNVIGPVSSEARTPPAFISANTTPAFSVAASIASEINLSSAESCPLARSRGKVSTASPTTAAAMASMGFLKADTIAATLGSGWIDSSTVKTSAPETRVTCPAASKSRVSRPTTLPHSQA